MPQLRKRKPKENNQVESEKKGRIEDSDISKNVTDKKKSSKTSISTNAKSRKSSVKRKKRDCPLSSDEESHEIHSKKTVLVNTYLKLEENITSIKNESDSENLHFQNSTDSGISTEISSDTIKDVKSEPTTSLTNDSTLNSDKSSSSESEWEEVEEHCEASLDDYKPDIPKEGVEITIDCPDLRIRKRKKKEFDEREWIRLHINRVRKDNQIAVHKTHLLCLLAHGIYVNKILNCDTVKSLALSLIPDYMISFTSGKKVDKINIQGIEKIAQWFRDAFKFENEKCVFVNLFSSLVKSFETANARNASEYNLLFIVLARVLGFKVRFCVSLYPVTYKASNLLMKPNDKKSSKKSTNAESEEKASTKTQTQEKQKKAKVKKEPKITKTPKERPKKPSKTKTKDIQEKKEVASRPRRSTKKDYNLSSDEDDSNDKDFEVNDDSSDEDFQKPPKVTPKVKCMSLKQPNRKILSSDSEPSSPQQSAFDSECIVCWAEIYSKPDKQWISIECANNIMNEPYEIEVLAPKPVTYILAYDNESYVKDVTRRYCSEYMTATIKLRIDSDWWEDTLEPFLPPNSVQNKTEEKKLNEMLVNKPLPHTIQGFKNHPLYALKRHLLKFEAIYPPDAPPVGFMRGDPVYARDCVHQLHSRETWLKEARVVRIGEQPYKIVKARPKWDKIAGLLRTDLPLEIFGHWQTEQYEPPIAVGGKVPRNEYGNVELFKPCMLPRGTVHLQLPCLNRIAKKLGIDCSPAVVGFDGHKGSVHPVFDGFVICEEFKDTILAAWDEEQENARKREEEKREKRIYGNWRKLIKGLLIRERIKLKYDTK